MENKHLHKLTMAYSIRLPENVTVEKFLRNGTKVESAKEFEELEKGEVLVIHHPSPEPHLVSELAVLNHDFRAPDFFTYENVVMYRMNKRFVFPFTDCPMI